MIHIFTCAAMNYFPKVRVLCRLLKRHHPELMIHVVLVDEVPDWLDTKSEPFDSLINIEQLQIPNLKSWLFRYSILELCTAVKPFALKYLMNTPGCEGVLYFDPDIVVFSRLDDLIDELRQNSILLIPHQTQPEQTFEAIVDNEVCSLRYGIFNLGFIGIRNDRHGRSFVKWWGERLDKFCYAALENGLWVDQKWVDFAPVFFEGVKILKSSRFNVATWNLTTRTLEGSFEKGFTVNGEPLGFYHFTGFDSGAHEIMATKYAGDNEAVKSLIRWYKTEIKKDKRVGSEPTIYSKYTMFQNGEPITKAHITIYRIRKDLQEAYPNPFEVTEDGRGYYEWFRQQAAVEHPEICSAQGYKDAKRSPVKTSVFIIWRRILMYLRRAVSDPKYCLYLWQTVRLIMRREGLSGLKRRLSGGEGCVKILGEKKRDS